MNYLGHAFVASLVSSEPAFVLGAMLPDFFHMARLEPAQLARVVMTDKHLERGVAFHHRTDASFHRAQPFVLAQRNMQSAFFEVGVTKGPARAMAHIGVEFLIDAAFIPHEDGYLEALAFGAAEMSIWHSWGESGDRLHALCKHLHTRGWTPHEITEVRLAERLRGALRERPRLEPSALEAELAATRLAASAAHVGLLSRRIVNDLLDELAPKASANDALSSPIRPT